MIIRLRRLRNALLRLPLVKTDDRERADTSRMVWGERDGRYTLSLLGALNGITREPWLAVDVDSAKLVLLRRR